MRVDLSAIAFAVRSSFWLIPVALGILAIATAILVVEADFAIQGRGVTYFPVLTMPIESARLALSTIAGSMITIASLVFSLTLVALTMVSGQLGPRVLLHFMDDRQTQIVLGLFIATFLFALIVLMSIGDEAYMNRVPGLAVMVTAGLAVFALGMMIRFIHHIATRIQADVLIAELGQQLNAAAQDLVRRAGDGDAGVGEAELAALGKRFDAEQTIKVSLDTSGYLRRLDVSAACALAAKHDLIIRLRAHPGEFVLSGVPVLTAVTGAGSETGKETLVKELRELISVGARRTPQASVEFEINALVEVALRALSPGVNDPYTAAACIGRLADGMRILMQRETEQRVTRDDHGGIRVIFASEPFSDYLRTAFGAVCDAAGADRIALEELRRMIDGLASLAKSETQRDELEKHATIVHDLMSGNRPSISADQENPQW